MRHPLVRSARLVCLAMALAALPGSARGEADGPACRGLLRDPAGGPVACAVTATPTGTGGLALTFELTGLPADVVAAEPGRLELLGPVRPGLLSLERLASASFSLRVGDRIFRATGAPAARGDLTVFVMLRQVDGPEVQEVLHATVHVTLTLAEVVGPRAIAPGLGDHLALTLEF